MNVNHEYMNATEIGIKQKYDKILGNYGEMLYDGFCGEPIAWGFPLLERVDCNMWNELSALGELEYRNGTSYALVTKWLTREEAIIKYGEVTDEEFGPKGGWKSVTLGEKKFISKRFRPFDGWID